MRPTKEIAHERRLREKVKKELGGIALKFLPWIFPGFPDRLVLLPGARVQWVETKRRGKTLSVAQRRVRKLLHRLGFTLIVLDSKEAVDEWVAGQTLLL